MAAEYNMIICFKQTLNGPGEQFIIVNDKNYFFCLHGFSAVL